MQQQPIARKGRPNQQPRDGGSRQLMRTSIRNRWPSLQRRAYKLYVHESPAINDNTNAAAQTPTAYPWVSIEDAADDTRVISFPVSLSEALMQHLLGCKRTDDEQSEGDFEDNSLGSDGIPHTTTPTQGSGDGHQDADARPTSTRKEKKSHRPNKFNLTKLNAIRFVCEATRCTLEVVPSSVKDCGDNLEGMKPRWVMISTPNPAYQSSAVDESDATEAVTLHSKPVKRKNWVELHEGLLLPLCSFLADVTIRYRTIESIPVVPSLFSASGGRRFFFDLRDTDWGMRLHISQVTEHHRNVVSVPLEDVTTFRDRLDTIIQALKLDNHMELRNTIRKRPRNNKANQQKDGDAPESKTREPGQRQRRRRYTGRRRFIIANRGHKTENGQEEQPEQPPPQQKPANSKSPNSSRRHRPRHNRQQNKSEKHQLLNGVDKTVSESPKQNENNLSGDAVVSTTTIDPEPTSVLPSLPLADPVA